MDKKMKPRDAAAALGVDINTVRNYAGKFPATHCQEKDEPLRVDLEVLWGVMHEVNPAKYGQRDLAGRLREVQQVGRECMDQTDSLMDEPVRRAQFLQEGSSAGGEVVGRIDAVEMDMMSLARRNEDAMLDLLRPKVQLEVQRRYRWWVRSLAAGIILAGAAVGGLCWFLSEARTAAAERAGQIAMATGRIEQLGKEVLAVAGRGDRLATDLQATQDSRAGLAAELVALTEEKGRLELLVSQGEDEQRNKDRLILEMSGKIEELEEGIRHLPRQASGTAGQAPGTRGDEEEEKKRIDVAVNLGKDN